MPPLVTIIIPTHNRVALLLQALGSCLIQTYSPLEIVVVDDGSTDGTREAVAAISRNAPHAGTIKYVYNPCGNASKARNVGIHLAQGDYIQFLDSDDELHPEKIHRQLLKLESAGAADEICNTCYGWMGLHPTEDADKRVRIGFLSDNTASLLEALLGPQVHVMQTSAPLWRGDVIKASGGWCEELTLGDDLELHVRLLSSKRPVGCLPEALFFVREHPGPRLSDAARDDSKLLSQIRTRSLILQVLHAKDLWNSRLQVAFLRSLRTLYANALDYGSQECLQAIESLILRSTLRPPRRIAFATTVLLRRALGRSLLYTTGKLVSGAIRGLTR